MFSGAGTRSENTAALPGSNRCFCRPARIIARVVLDRIHDLNRLVRRIRRDPAAGVS
jgi:hypothetical protein